MIVYKFGTPKMEETSLADDTMEKSMWILMEYSKLLLMDTKLC